MFQDWFNPHQARAEKGVMENSVAFGVEEMSPRRKKQFRVKSSETRVSTTEEIDTRVLAGPRQCDPRYSLSLSLPLFFLCVCFWLPSPSQQKT